jgi:hypothetical protein
LQIFLRIKLFVMNKLWLFLLFCSLVQAGNAQRNREEFTTLYWTGEAKGNDIPSVFLVGVAGQVGYLRGVVTPGQTAGALGWRVHFGMGVPVNRTIYIHPELAFSQLRTGDNQNGLTITSMDMPMQLGLHVGKCKQWFIKAGPEFSLALGGKQRLTGVQKDVYQAMQQTQWFATTAIEYLHKRVGFSLRYRHGFTKISDASSGAMAGKFSAISGGMIFKLAKSAK